MDTARSRPVLAADPPEALVANIQLLRGLAAALVAMVHLAPLLDHAGLGFNAGFARAGVDVFFVVSGFIMQRIAEQSRPTPSRFLRNRAARIVPVYALGTLAFFAAAQVVPPAGIEAGWRQLIASLLFLPQGAAPYYPLLYVGWTLNFEVYFYLLFALLLAARVPSTTRIAAMSALLAAPLLLRAAGLLPAGPVEFYANAIVFEFVAGMLLAAAYPRLDRFRPAVAAAAATAGVTGMVVGDTWPLYTRLLYYGVPAILVVFAALVLERRGHRATAPWALWLGAISYPLYITHPLVLSGFSKLSQRIADEGSLLAAALAVAGAIASLAVAALVHRWFEVPLARALRSRAAPPPVYDAPGGGRSELGADKRAAIR